MCLSAAVFVNLLHYSFSMVHLSHSLDMFNTSFRLMLYPLDDDDRSEGASTTHSMSSSDIQHLSDCLGQ